jgi:hypothetical protein
MVRHQFLSSLLHAVVILDWQCLKIPSAVELLDRIGQTLIDLSDFQILEGSEFIFSLLRVIDILIWFGADVPSLLIMLR